MNPEDDKGEPSVINISNTEDFIKHFGSLSPGVSVNEACYDTYISKYVSQAYLDSMLTSDKFFGRREPTTMVPVSDGIRAVPNSELVKLFQEKDELERLCEEIPGIKELYDQLQTAIRLYRE